jgi:hypothetical protein
MLAHEVVASIASTVMATVVSTVALVFSYRQNVGWKPVALVTKGMLSGTGGTTCHTLHLSVEFWNRRKFPVALRLAKANVTGVEILDSDSSSPGCSDFVRKNSAVKELNILIEPSRSEKIDFELSFENQSLDAMRPHFNIELRYFNPHKNGEESIHVEHKFFHPHLGWGKSEEQRSKILRVFEQVRESNEARRESIEAKAELRQIAGILGVDGAKDSR